MPEKNGDKSTAARIIAILISIYILSTIGWCGWMSNKLISLEKFQAETSGNRFTSGDGKEVWMSIAQIKADIEIVKHADNPPQQWLLDRVNRLENEINQNHKEVMVEIVNLRNRLGE